MIKTDLSACFPPRPCSLPSECATDAIESSTAGPLSTLDRLQSSLTEISQFLPSPEIKEFDPKTVNAAELDLIFNTLGFSFCFDSEVKDLIVKYKGYFTLFPPPLQCASVEEGAAACDELSKLILQKAPAILDKNLLILWKSITKAYPGVPSFENPVHIREWLKNEENLDLLETIKEINLIKSDMEILPPEILLFPNLNAIYLYDAALSDDPIIAYAHPNFKNNKLTIEFDSYSLKRFEGIKP
ncbi:MAG: hypothetical protein Tsb0015_07810 [Simkaniaceae bacterium]